MSAPHDTNVETQAKRHSFPLWGIILALLVGGLFALLITFNSVAGGDDPEGADVQVDGRTGELVEGEETTPSDQVGVGDAD